MSIILEKYIEEIKRNTQRSVADTTPHPIV